MPGAHVSDPHDKTCSWVTQHDGYQRWQKQRKGIFWIKGKAGCGKSTLLKYLWRQRTSFEKSGPQIRSPGSREEDKKRVSAAFFFNSRGTNLEQTSAGLYRTLLSQIYDQNPVVYRRHAQKLKEMHEEMVEKTQEDTGNTECWKLSELELLFQSIFENKGIEVTITLFIDALDECNEHEWDRVLMMLNKCVASSEMTDIALSVCLSSRPNPELDVGKCQSLMLQDENHADIVDFVQSQLRSKAPNGRTTDYNKEFADQVIDKADGVFLWVSLVVPKLRKAISRGDTLRRLRNMLNEIPIPLEELFEHILQKLDKDTLLDTVHLLRWALFSDAHLSLDQFRHTFVAQPSCPCANIAEWEMSDECIEDSRQMEQQIESRCGGLVEVFGLDPDRAKERAEEYNKYQTYSQTFANQPTGRAKRPQVQMIHETAKQFFIKGLGFKRLAAMIKENQGTRTSRAFEHSLSQYHVSSGHDYLARSCLRYLVLVPRALEIMLSQYHTSSAPDNLTMARLQYLGLPKDLALPGSAEFPLVYYAAQFCFKHAGEANTHGMAQDHLYEALKDLSNGSLETLLIVAAHHGITSWVILLKEDQVDIDTREIGYGNPIKAAVRSGNVEMVSALIDCGADINGSDGNDQSTLSIAYSKGDRQMVDFLTAKGARIDLNHRMQAATKEQEGSGDLKHIVRLLNNNVFKRSYPSRITELE